MASEHSITVLHVSDMQFGKNHRFTRQDSLYASLTDDLKDVQGSERLEPNLLVVSGDLAEWGRPSEFRDALAFVEQLTEFLKLPREHVVIVPGNHDVSRSDCQAYFAKCEGSETKVHDSALGRLHRRSSRHTRQHARRLGRLHPDRAL